MNRLSPDTVLVVLLISSFPYLAWKATYFIVNAKDPFQTVNKAAKFLKIGCILHHGEA